MSGRRAQTDAQAEEGPTRGRRRRRGEEDRVEWRQFATKIQMNDEKSRERVSPSGIGMGARIPTDVSSAILGIALLYISFPWENPAFRKTFYRMGSRVHTFACARDGPFPGRRGRSRLVPFRRRKERQTTTTKWGIVEINEERE